MAAGLVRFLAVAVLGGLVARCAGPPEEVPRSMAYEHIFEVVVLAPDPETGSYTADIMRLGEAEQAAVSDPAVAFLPDESEIERVAEEIAAGSEGDYSQSLRATKIEDGTWELRLSTGGNTVRDVSTYRTDGRTITPVRYERSAVMSRTRRYVYMDEGP